MKRTKSMALVLGLAVLLAACDLQGADESADAEDPVEGDDAGDGDEAGGDADVAEPDEDQISVAFVPQVAGIPYYDGMRNGGERAAEELGFEYVQEGPAEAQSPEQLRILEALAAREFDAISLSPVDPTSVNSFIDDTVADGIPVITSDADAPESDRLVYAAQATNEELGEVLIDDLARQIDESGEIAIVSGDPDTQTFVEWIAAMEDRLEDYPDIEVVDDVRHTVDSEDALREAEDLMTAYPDLDGIVAVPSTAVPGVGQAVQNAGKTGEVAVIGYGSPQTAADYLESGVMETTVLWDVEALGYLNAWAMYQLAQGEEFEEVNDVPGLDEPVEYDEEEEMLILGEPMIFDADNYDQYDF